MSWDEHSRRRAALKAVLDHAERNPGAGLPYDELPEVATIFKDRRELVLALQYDWSQKLWARIELLSLDGGRRRGRLADARELAEIARGECAAKHPVLRRLLDSYRDEIGPAVLRGQDLLSCA